jgi:hypothetical protein
MKYRCYRITRGLHDRSSSPADLLQFFFCSFRPRGLCKPSSLPSKANWKHFLLKRRRLETEADNSQTSTATATQSYISSRNSLIKQDCCRGLVEWDRVPPVVTPVCCVRRLLESPQLVYKHGGTARSVDATLETSRLASIILEMSPITVFGVHKPQEGGAQSQSWVDCWLSNGSDAGGYWIALHVCTDWAAGVGGYRPGKQHYDVQKRIFICGQQGRDLWSDRLNPESNKL